MLHCVAIIQFCLSILHLINNLGCFSHLTIINNAAVNILVQFFCFTFYCMGVCFESLGEYLGVELLGHMITLCLSFLRTATLFFPMLLHHQLCMMIKMVSHPSCVHGTIYAFYS